MPSVLSNFNCNSQDPITPPRCSLAGEWLNKRSYIHTMEYYLAIKKNQLLIHTQLGWILKQICCMKQVSPERLHSLQFHLCNILGVRKLRKW